MLGRATAGLPESGPGCSVGGTRGDFHANPAVSTGDVDVPADCAFGNAEAVGDQLLRRHVGPHSGRSKQELAQADPIRRGTSLLQQPLHSAEEAGRQLVELYKIIGTPAESYPLDVQRLTEVGAISF